MPVASVLVRADKLRMQLEDRILENGEQDALVLLAEHRSQDSVHLMELLCREIEQDFRVMDQRRHRTEQRRRVLEMSLKILELVARHLGQRAQMFALGEELVGANRRVNS
jgi:hypothetical protein